MTVNKTPIPQRLKNVSNDHPYVAGAIDIIDDATGDNQQEINADTYRKSETYSKEQLNNMITTPEQKYENYTAEDGDTFSDLGLPAEGEADTTYRVGSWDGTEYNASKFSEYSWDGTQYILLSVQSPGIDEQPSEGSGKLVESGGVKAELNRVFKTTGGENLVYENEWEQGGISSSDGTNTSTNKNYRIRTKAIAFANNDLRVTLPSGMYIYIMKYSSNGTFLDAYGWQESLTIMYGTYYRLVLAYDTADTLPSTTISVDDLQYVDISMNGLYEVAPNIYDAVSDFNITVDSQVVLKRYINSDLEWAATSSSYKGKGAIVDVTRFKGQIIKIENEHLTNTYYAALTNDSHVVGETPAFANSDKKKYIQPGVSEEIVIDDTINYIFIPATDSEDNDIYPTVTVFGKVNYQNKKVLEYGGQIKNLNESVFDTVFEEEDLTLVGRVINAGTKKWMSSSTGKGVFIDVSAYHGRSMSIENEDDELKTYYAALEDDSSTPGTTPSYSTPDKRKYVNPGEKTTFKITDNTNFIYVCAKSLDGDDIYPVVTLLNSIVAEVREDTSIPLIYKNVQKKSSQLHHLVWNAKGDISNNISEGEQLGMLYSSVVEVDRYVGYDITLKTFMTAANNPYSLLYTEHLEEDNHSSGYGFTYYTNRNTGRGYMGTVCSRLTGYASGMDIEYDTAFMAWLCKEGVFTKIEDQSAQGVEIGDWIWISGHVRIVTDIIKRDGWVSSVVVAEAWIPRCRTVSLSTNDFNSYLSTNHGIIYRYNELCRNTVYQPSQFVNVDDEPMPEDYEYNNDICTYAGDYTVFYEGFPIWLNYNLEEVGDWTAIELYKESWSRANVLSTTLVDTFEIDPTEHKIRLDTDESPLEHGLYRARMTDGTNYSDYTYFEVIEVEESVSIPNESNPDIKRVDFSSSNGTPVRVVFCDIDGTPRAIKNLTQDDRMNGYVLMNPKALCQVQRDETLPSTVYLRVYVKGKYGRVSRQITMDNQRFINWE